MKKFLLILMTCVMAMSLYAQIPAGDAQPCPGTPTVTDHEGNVYNTVKIGNQCWMKENLRTTTSPSTGTYLIPPAGTDATRTGKQARWYNNDSATYARKNYGLLYNWNAAVDTFNTAFGEISMNTDYLNGVFVTFRGHRRGICPAGWHLPSDAEWTVLTDYVGSVPGYLCGGDSGYIAKALASENFDYTNNSFDDECSPGIQSVTANNATGFSALPTGTWYGSYYNGAYEEDQVSFKKRSLEFWCTTHRDSIRVYYRYMFSWSHDLHRDYGAKDYGRSVRCLRDEAIVACPGIPTVTDYDSNVYNTVKIGDQCWMKENLRTTHFADGNPIYPGDWDSTNNNTNPYYYENPDSEIPLAECGLLYNWSAATSACPAGWHLPTDAEWTTLEATQTTYNLTGTGWRGDHAGRLAGGSDWHYTTSTPDSTPGLSNYLNVSGFTAIPAGYHYNSYMESKWGAYFWTATSGGGTLAWHRKLYYNKIGVYHSTKDTKFGLSVRCLRNPVPVVNTGAVLGVTTTTATCDGEVVDDGGASVTARGICWSTSHNPTVADAHTSNGTGLGSFTGSITGLTQGTTYYVRAYATNSEGTTYGIEKSYTSSPPCPGTPTVTDHEGNVYNTVRIGNQCWTKENLRTTTSPSTGTYLIPDPSANYTYTGKQAHWYDNDSATYAPLNYGLLYNWAAAMDGASSSDANPSGVQGICPNGWHLPSIAEWVQLKNYVGRQSEYTCSGDNYNIAKALASTEGWNSNIGNCVVGNDPSSNNATGFSAVPAGYCNGSSFYDAGYDTEFWSSRWYDYDFAYYFYLYYDRAGVSYDHHGDNIYGRSVRCLRDPVLSVNTGSVLGVTTTTATCSGEVWDDGGFNVTARGVCWSTNHNPTVADTHTNNGTGLGQFTSSITGLTPSTTYYVRAYATNSEGTTYGEEVSFTTLACPTPDVISASGITTESATINWNGSSDSYLVRYRTPAQVYFKEDFENGLPSTWTTIDQDGDGHNWSSYSNTTVPAHSGTESVASESFDLNAYAALSPDNWLITPKIDLQGVMKVWLRSEDPDYPNEHFAIYLSTTGNAVSDFTTTLVGETISTSTYTEYSADLSNYAGQQGYVAIRHFNCRDMFKLVVDDFGLYETDAPVWHTVTSNTNSASLTGLIPGTPYEVQVQGVCAEYNTDWSDTLRIITNCRPEDQCELTFVLTDSYGDSWNGNAILVKDAQTGVLLGYMTNEDMDGLYEPDETTTMPLALCNGKTVNFEWVEGSWPQETSYTVYDGNGEEIFSGTGGFTEPISYTVNCVTPCPAISLPYTENFDSYTTSTTAATGVEPDCWELVKQDAAMSDANRPQLCYNSNFAHSSSYSLKLANRGIYAMPELELDDETSISQVKLEMYLRQANARYQLQVGVWDGQTFVPVATFDNSTTNVEFVTCDFSSYNGNGTRIAFRNTLGDGSNIAFSTNYLDDITLTINEEHCSITLPYSENFDSYTQSTTTATGVQPTCWELVHIDAPSMPDDKLPQLYYNSSFAHSGNYSLKLYNRGIYAMPELELDDETSISQVKLEMYLRQANASYQLQVGVWDGQMFVPVATFNNSTTNVEFVTCDFSGYNGNGNRIAFRNVLGSGTYAYSVNYLDDITLTINEENCSITLPYSENFDSYTQSTTAATGVQPTCWELVRVDAPSMPDDKLPQLYYNSSFAHSGSYSLKLYNRGIYAMPELELDEETSFSQVKLDMYLRQANAKYQLQVGVWDGQTFVPVATFNNSTTDVEHVTCDFSSYNGNGRRIAFRNTLGSGSTVAYSTNYLDDITLSVNTSTGCEAITLPYSENFDSYTQSTTTATGVQPDCWELVHIDAPSMPDDRLPQIYYNSGFAHSGDYSLKLYNRGIYAMPELELNAETSMSQVKLEMYLRQANAAYQLQVGVWDGQMFEPVATFNNSTTNVEFVTCDFSNYTGNGRRIAFRNTLGSGSYAYSVNYLDDITLTVVQDCSITLPYSEPFENYTNSTTAATGVQPDCWEVVRVDAPSMPDDKLPQIYYNSSFAHSGDYTLKLGNRCVYAMPELEPNVPMNRISLEMYLRQANAAYRLQVGVWDGQEFVPVATFNNSTTGVEHVTCDFSSYTGNGRRIAFRNTLGSGSYAYSYNYLDDITLSRITNKSAEVTNANTTGAGMLGADRDMVDFIVYPNPTRDYINVQCTMYNVQSVEVIDVYGKVVRTDVETLRATSLPTRINVSGLAAGIYFVRVTTEEGVVTKPFVKR